MTHIPLVGPLLKLFMILSLGYFFFRSFDTGFEKLLIFSGIVVFVFILNFINFRSKIQKDLRPKLKTKPKQKFEKHKGNFLDIEA